MADAGGEGRAAWVAAGGGEDRGEGLVDTAGEAGAGHDIGVDAVVAEGLFEEVGLEDASRVGGGQQRRMRSRWTSRFWRATRGLRYQDGWERLPRSSQ